MDRQVQRDVKVKIATVQFAPQLCDVEGNIARCDELLGGCSAADGLDFVVLPEMAFTGYNFTSTDHVRPFAENVVLSENDGDGLWGAGGGRTVEWARATAVRLNAFVQVGFPRKEGVGETERMYNSVVLVDRRGGLHSVYDKHFLFTTDEAWATPGRSFASTTVEVRAGERVRVGFGICMDLNPERFTAPYEAREFAHFQRQAGTGLVLCSMAWLASADAVERQLVVERSTVNYWADRLLPLVGSSAGAVVVVIANRVGAEGETTFCGSSCVLRFSRGGDNVNDIDDDGDGVIELCGNGGVCSWKESRLAVCSTSVVATTETTPQAAS